MASLSWEKWDCLIGAARPKHLNVTRQGVGLLWSEEVGWDACLELASSNTQVGLSLVLLL